MPKLIAGDQDADGRRARFSALVVGQPEPRVLYLARAGLALELLVDLVQHPQAGRTDGVPEALQTAVGVHGQLALQRERAGLDVFLDLAPRAELQVFHDGELGDGEAVMHLGHADLLARVLDAGLLVGGDAAAVGLLHVGEVVIWLSQPSRRPWQIWAP